VGDTLIASNDDRRGTTGVSKRAFSAIDPDSAVDVGVDQADPTFQVGGIDALQATGRDAPTVIGAIFLLRNFWNGRANHFFNGRNIWGEQDPTDPTVLRMEADGSLSEVSILLNNAATASQAVGPVLSDVEMSWGNRNWVDVGQKMVPRTPLANQFVDPTDSQLGALANQAGLGLDPLLTYADLIEAAFHEQWWGSSELTEGFTHMEANFSLFFGLAILAYESTLVPDQAPYDAFAAGNQLALSPEAQRGLGIFLGKGKCADCHATPLFAGNVATEVLSHSDPNEGEGILERMDMGRAFASAGLTLSTNPGPGELPLAFNPYHRVVNILRNGVVIAKGQTPFGSQCPPAGETVIQLAPGAVVSPESEMQAVLRLRADGQCGLEVDVELEWNEFGPPGGAVVVAFGSGNRFTLTMPEPNFRAVYDNGFYNVGVRPSTEDLGVGGDGPFGPLSLTKRVQNGEDIGFESSGVGTVDAFQRIAVDGAFKTPTLRNIELTGPYFHNGGMATLEQVVEFYTRGTDFASENEHDLDPDVSGIEAMTQQDVADLVAFLKSLTDERVRREQAPFDHPELPLKEGLEGNALSITDDGSGNGIPRIEIVPATGAAGGPPIPTFEDSLRLPVLRTGRGVR
jgi:cytochrome c peroxidase